MEATPKRCSFCDLPAVYVLMEDGKPTDMYSCAEYFELETTEENSDLQWVPIND